MRGLDLYLFQFTRDFIESTSNDDRIGRLQKKELISNLIRTIMYNMDRYKSIDEIINSFSQIILESNPEETNEAATRALHELTYKVGLHLERITTYFQVRQVVNSVLEKIGSYADDNVAAKFDRLSVMYKNQIRRMTEYDKQKLLKEITELSGSITSKFNPEELTKDKKRKIDEVHSKELIPIINQKIEQIIQNQAKLKETIQNQAKFADIIQKIDQIIKTQESFSERIKNFEEKLVILDKNINEKTVFKKKDHKIKNDLTETSEAMDKLDKNVLTEEDTLYGKVSDVEEVEEESVNEEEIKDNLSESLKDFLGKKK